MNKNDDLRRKLWEYVYGLLSAKDSAEVERLVTSDPEVSRAYAEVKRETELLAKAARLEDSPLPLSRTPIDDAHVEATRRGKSLENPKQHRRSRGVSWVNWMVGLSAVALLCLLGYTYIRPESPINPRATEAAQRVIARQHIRTVISGPAKLQPGVSNYFQVMTTDVAGNGRGAEINYRLYDTATGELKLERRRASSGDGRLRLDIPSHLVSHNARFEVETIDRQQRISTFQTHLKVDQVRYVTHLSVDKPLYRPGETVFFRSLTLSRFGMHDDRNLAVAFEILDPSGTVVPQSRQTGYTQRGVGNGAFTIPPARPGGTYTLVARSPENGFPAVKRSFMVREYRTPRLKKELEFTRDSYAPGDVVVADFSAHRAEGGAVAGGKLEIQVSIDREKVPVDVADPETKDDGTFQVKFHLPKRIETGAGTLAVVIDDGGNKETIAKSIPINLGKVEIAFYPEGGDLVGGLENRVYFHAVDPLGKSVHVRGWVVDDQGNKIVQIETAADSEGRGSFRFTPQDGRSYRLEIDQPSGVEGSSELPAAAPAAFLVIDSGEGVFAAGQPVQVRIRSHKNRPLVVSAVCRGAQVGQQHLRQAGKVSLPLAAEAAGVIRLTVYDYSQSPPQPLAERLVYLQPANYLNVHVADPSPAYSPGDHVKLSLIASREGGKPVAAVMGVRVVDDTLLNLAEDKSAAMTTNFLLASEIEKPEDLEEADFFLSDDENARRALDLLLGTQGWRRFAALSLDELADAGKTTGETHVAGEDDDPLARLLALDHETGPPLVADNLPDVRARHAASLAAFRHGRREQLNRLGQMTLFAGAVVLGLLAIAMLLRLTSGPKVWLPALTMSAACLAAGFLWIGARIDPQGEISLVPFSSFQVQQERISQIAPSSGAVWESRELGENANWDVNGRWAYQWHAPIADELMDWEKEVAAVDPFDDGIDNKRIVAGAILFEDFGMEMEGADVLRAMGALGDVRDFDHDGAGADLGRFFDGYFARVRQPDASGPPGLGRWAGAGRGPERGIELYEFAIRDAAERGDVEQVLQLAAKLKSQLDRVRFPVRQYAHVHQPVEEPGVRRDFAETIYWHPLLIADASGRATVEFDLSDSVTTFQVLTDAHGGGRIGLGTASIIARIPFSLEPKLPLEVNAGDRIDLPLAMNNDTGDKLPVSVTLRHGNMLQLAGDAQRLVELPASTRHREHFSLDVVGNVGQADVEFRGLAGALADGVKKSIRVVPPGFPIEQSWAGEIAEAKELTIELPKSWVPGSLDVTLSVFPSTLADLQDGIAGILREPSGCFEQTSSSNYPNILALRYMQEHDAADPQFTRRAKEMLKQGYGKLLSFECSEKGYEWFGGDPGHEALTAYGLMEFQDMAAVWDVDRQMVTRTTNWLLDRRDGKGRFTRNPRALDSFGGAPQDITDAYIVWALTETQDDQIFVKLRKEIDHVIGLAQESEDPYLIALVAASACNVGRLEGARLLAKLAEFQHDDGHLEGKQGTITRSGGSSLKVETTALAAIAWLKRPEFVPSSDKAVRWITESRQGGGGFGSTQATILALKALIENARANRKVVHDGSLVLEIEGVEVGHSEFKAGATHAIRLENIARHLQPGKNDLTIRLTGGNEMPYAVGMQYRTRQPVSSERCPLQLSTRLAADKVRAGDTVGLWVELENNSGEGQPMSLAIVGLPAGLEARQGQLDELKQRGMFDYYELRGRELIFYWRSLGPDVIGDDRITFDLDLLAEIPGQYTGPASRTYRYYTAEEKNWTQPLEVSIER